MGLNPMAKQLIIERMHKDSIDGRRGVPGSGRRDKASNGDYRSGYSDGYADAVNNMSNSDGRRGVKGTGRYGIGGRDYADMANDYADYHGNEEIYLSDKEIEKWKYSLRNNDGSKGPYFDYQAVMQIAKRCGIKFEDFTAEEFCMAMNLLYSDLCRTNSKYIPKERELEYYACLAKEWLAEDEDGPSASEKLAAKYYMTEH